MSILPSEVMAMQSGPLRDGDDGQSAAFGRTLRQIRASQTTYARRSNQWGTIWVTAPLSQNELARRASLAPSSVNKIEAGTYGRPSRPVVERLAEALELDDVGTSHLLIAAGYWPWHDLDEDTALLVAQTALAVIAGDYRTLEDAP